MKKANVTTYYTHGELNYNGVSVERFDTLEEAERECIEVMKRLYSNGYSLNDRAIIRVDSLCIADEFMTIKTEHTMTTVLVVNKHCVEEE